MHCKLLWKIGEFESSCKLNLIYFQRILGLENVSSRFWQRRQAGRSKDGKMNKVWSHFGRFFMNIPLQSLPKRSSGRSAIASIGIDKVNCRHMNVVDYDRVLVSLKEKFCGIDRFIASISARLPTDAAQDQTSREKLHDCAAAAIDCRFIIRFFRFDSKVTRSRQKEPTRVAWH